MMRMANDATTLWIDTPWDTPPDSTSRFIVEAPAWQYFAESNPTRNSDRTLETTIRVSVENLFEQQFLVQAVAVDAVGVESPDSLSPAREIYVYGSLQSLLTEGIQNYVIEDGLSTKPASGLTMDSPETVVFVNGSQVTVPTQTYTYPANKFISDEITPDGQLVHLEYDNYTDIPAVPESGGVRVQQVETGGSNIVGVFNRRTLEPRTKELFGGAFRWQKIISELEITDAEGPGNSYPTGTQVKKFTGAYRYAPNNGILWYFSNLGLFFLVGHLENEKIKSYLDVYITNLGNNYDANDVFANPDATLDVNKITGNPDPVRPPDSHDSYAATFLMLAVRYLRHTHDWDWLDEVNSRFNESNLQTILNIANNNITSQIKTVAWCNANGFAVDYPNGRNTLLVNTFQNGQNPAGGAYDISFKADNCECYRGLKDFGDLLADIGESNAATILQHAENIGIAAPGWYERADYDSFPNNFYGYLAAARRRDYTKAAKALDKFLKYYLNVQGPQFPAQATLSGNTSGFSLLSEVGFGIGIQDTVTIAMAGHTEDSSCPYRALTVKKLRSVQQTAQALKKKLLTAGTAIKPNALSCPIGASANVTITATPSIETSGVEGDSLLILYNVDDVYIELQDESALAGSKLRLGASSIRLNRYESAYFVYSKLADAWIKINNNALAALAAGYVKVTDKPGPAKRCQCRILRSARSAIRAIR